MADNELKSTMLKLAETMEALADEYEKREEAPVIQKVASEDPGGYGKLGSGFASQNDPLTNFLLGH